MRNIILLGFKGSGKSTVGKELAKLAEAHFIDTDKCLEDLFKARYKKKEKVKEIYSCLGVEGFRALEEQAVLGLKHLQNCVIATGGGTPLSEQNQRILKDLGLCLHLDVPFSLVEMRMGEYSSSLYQGNLKECFALRRQIYQNLAHIQISVEEDMTVTDIAKIIFQFKKESEYGQQ